LKARKEGPLGQTRGKKKEKDGSWANKEKNQKGWSGTGLNPGNGASVKDGEVDQIGSKGTWGSIEIRKIRMEKKGEALWGKEKLKKRPISWARKKNQVVRGPKGG